MSSILNALRKVESESVQAERTQPSLGKKINAKGVIRSRHRESRLGKKLLLFMMPALTLALALWVAFQYGLFPILKASTAPAKLPDPQKQEPSPKEQLREDPEDRKPSDPTQPPYAKERNSLSKSRPEKENPSALPTKKPTPREEGPASEDPELKLQAIVWSESPENCFAVINGVIVRVGGKVDGVSVIQIEADSVSLKSGQRTWKIRMMTE